MCSRFLCAAGIGTAAVNLQEQEEFRKGFLLFEKALLEGRGWCVDGAEIGVEG